MDSSGSTTAEKHYDSAYFDWQRSISPFSGMANQFRYRPHIRPSDRVVDFGCGGGYLLSGLKCAERRGVEVNPHARTEAERNGLTCVSRVEDLPDDWADVVISHSALEHCEFPLGELRKLLPKVKRGGRVVFSIPHETLAAYYSPDDINQHLYTWSPRDLGNLFRLAGFEVLQVTPSRLMWPPMYRTVWRLLGERLFLWTCAAYRAARFVLWPLRPVDSHAMITIVARRAN